MKEKYLPIGSVVTLENATKRIMIIGYLPMGEDNKVFDYSACTYPEGVLKPDKILAFNHSQIKEINFEGLSDTECTEFIDKIKGAVKSIEEIKNIKFATDNTVSQTTNQGATNLSLDNNVVQSNSVNDVMDL